MDGSALPSLEERLERGELVPFAPCPFPLPAGEDRQFLFVQQVAGKKNITFNPHNGIATGFVTQTAAQAERLTRLLRGFAQSAEHWVRAALPRYAHALYFDRVTFRPDEEATRKLRVTARNDLLHIDAFPSRPARGARILRLYANIHATDPRVWATSLTFPELLERYGEAAGLPADFQETWTRRLGQGLLGLFQPGSQQRTAYDHFMLRLHHHLKTNEQFQDKAPRRLWQFPPNSAWLAFTDSLSHAELRGRFALEHSFFVPRQALALPEESPAAQLERACQQRSSPRDVAA